MSRMQRDKGRRGELEVAALFREYGFEAELVRGQEEIGGEQGDVTTSLGNAEVKRRGVLPKWLSLRSDAIQMIWVRRDFGRWMVIVDGPGYLSDQRGAEKRLDENSRLRRAVCTTAEAHAHLRRQLDTEMPRACAAAPCTCTACVLARELGLVPYND